MATSRSLGTLSVDLIAKISGFTEGMSRAEREADRKGRDIARKQKQAAKEIDAAWNKATQAIGAAFAAISVGALASKLVGITKETANLAIEYDKLATLSGATNQGFQRFAAGAETVGISAEKLADIFKDVQDKAGDFAQTGGGGMADFFENIAPKVGVTIEQFRRLSGPEAMQLYVSSLEKANLSQQDMIFYMEAIASDSSLLLPLLRDNGAEFQRLGDAAERAGAIMGDEALNAAREYKAQTEELDRAMKGVRVEIMQELLPALNQITALFTDPAVRQAIVDYAGWLGNIADTAARFAQVVSGSSFWGWLQVGADDAKDVGAAITETEGKIQELQKTLTSLQRPFSKFWNADDIAIVEGQISTLQSKLQALYATRDQANAAATKSLTTLGLQGLEGYSDGSAPTNSGQLSPVVSKPKGTSGKSQIEKDREEAQRYLKALQELVVGRKEMNTAEQLAYDLQTGRLKLNDKEVEQYKLLADEADKRRDAEMALNQEMEMRNRWFTEGAALTESLMTPLERYSDQMENLTLLLEKGAIDQETWGRAQKKYYKDLTGAATDYAKVASKNIQNLLGDWLASGLDGSFKDILASFGKMLLQMEAQALSANIIGIITGKQSGAGGSVIGSIIGGLFGGGKATGGQVSPGMLYEVNEGGPEMLTMGGRDYLMTGSQAGYVTPNAARISSDQGPRGGNVTIVNQTTGRIDHVEERRIGAEDRVLIVQESVAAMRAEMQNPNSRTSRTMVQNFNTSRRRT